MKNELKALAVFLLTDLVMYLLFVIQEVTFVIKNWKDPMSKLHFEAYVIFNYALTIFYYIDKKWHPTIKK